MTANLLEVTDLTVTFPTDGGDLHAVRGLSYHVAPGEVVAMVGESGSGKSAAAMAVIGLLPEYATVSGSATLHGEQLLGMSDAGLSKIRGARIGTVFQDPMSALTPVYPVGAQIAEAIRVHHPDVSKSEAGRRAVELLELVGLAQAERRTRAFPHELSGGERQRVVIAIAIANNPDLIICDEPTTALDVTVQAQILRLLDELRHERQAGVLFITHDFGVVSEVCDRVAVMYAGRIVETGPTEAVLSAPAHHYTRMLIDCVPVMGEPERRLEAIAGLPPSLDDLPPGCAFAERCPAAQDDCRRGDIAQRPFGSERGVRCLYPLEAPS